MEILIFMEICSLTAQRLCLCMQLILWKLTVRREHICALCEDVRSYTVYIYIYIYMYSRQIGLLCISMHFFSNQTWVWIISKHAIVDGTRWNMILWYFRRKAALFGLGKLINKEYCLINYVDNYVSQITLWDSYIVFYRVLVFLATHMCYIPFERVFDVD